jgi:plastocyanin
MRIIGSASLTFLCCAMVLAAGCSGKPKVEQTATPAAQPAVTYFKVDPAAAGSVSGTVHFTGKRPARKLIDMSEDPACVEAHQGKAYDESLVVSPNGSLGNVFIYVKAGLEGKNFEVPKTAVTIDQRGCWFRPRVLGVQTGQTLEVVNSDPVTHNIHPMAQVNREWNHSQGPGDAPLHRRFLKPEIMIRVKCNIHHWMHAFIGVVDHPYFTVSKDDGTFEIPNLPAGTYTLEAWQENLGTREMQVTVTAGGKTTTKIVFKGQ